MPARGIDVRPQKTNFDVASDAFATFRQCLTKHKTLSSTFLEQNYDKVVGVLHRLISIVKVFRRLFRCTTN